MLGLVLMCLASFAEVLTGKVVAVTDGMAWHYKFFDKTPSYAQVELEAREKKVGLWDDPNPIEPFEFRKAKRK